MVKTRYSTKKGKKKPPQMKPATFGPDDDDEFDPSLEHDFDLLGSQFKCELRVRVI